MPSALVDSNVLIAASSEKDGHHDEGRSIVRRADADELPTLRVTNYVLAETLNWIHNHVNHHAAVDLYRRLETSLGFVLDRVTEGGDRGALALFETHETLSFVDASIGAYAARNELDYCYSFDDDIDRLDDVTRISNAVDPFAPE